MKRELGDLSIAPMRERGPRHQEGAFVPVLRRVRDLASYVDMLDEEVDENASRSSLTEEFADFLAGEAAADRDLLAPSPIFRERLRRRLWRLQTLTRSRAGLGIH
jgi:hypothetical protein